MDETGVISGEIIVSLIWNLGMGKSSPWKQSREKWSPGVWMGKYGGLVKGHEFSVPNPTSLW